MPDELLTTAQAAERLGIDVSGVRRLILAKRLPAEKWGRDYQIRAADVAALPPRAKGRPRTRERETRG